MNNELKVYDIGTDSGKYLGQVEAINEDEAYSKACEKWPDEVVTGQYQDKEFLIVLGEADEVENEFELDFEDEPTIVESDISEYNWDDEDEVECGWCGEYYPATDCKKEKDLGYICPQCQAAIKSRGEELTFTEEADVDADAEISKDEYNDEDKDTVAITNDNENILVDEESENENDELTEDTSITDIKAELNKTLDSFTEDVEFSKFILEEPLDELEEADCKLYKAITHPDDDMKILKEEETEDKVCPDCGKEICECDSSKLVKEETEDAFKDAEVELLESTDGGKLLQNDSNQLNDIAKLLNSELQKKGLSDEAFRVMTSGKPEEWGSIFLLGINGVAQKLVNAIHSLEGKLGFDWEKEDELKFPQCSGIKISKIRLLRTMMNEEDNE